MPETEPPGLPNRPRAPESSASGASRLEWGLAAALVLGALLLPCCLAEGQIRMVADGTDYLSIARAVLEGRGLSLDFKWHYFHSQPPPMSAASERPVLYPLILAAAMGLGAGPLTANLVTTAASAMLLFALLRPGSGRVAAWSALALFLTTAPTWFALLRPLAESLFLALVLSADVVLARTEGWRRACWAGLLLGLVALTRPEGLLLAVPAAALVSRRDGLRPAVGVMLLATGLALLPWVFSDQPSMFAQHLRVRSLEEGMWSGYGRAFPSAPEFLAREAGAVAQAALHLELGGLGRLAWCLGPLALPPLALLLPAIRSRLDPVWPVVGAQGLLSLVASHAVWSIAAPYDAKFYLVPVALLGASSAAVLATWRGAGPPVTAGIVALLVLVQAPPATRILSTPRLAEAQLQGRSEPFQWLRRNVRSGTVAAANPWSVHEATHLPTILLPYGLPEEQMRRFLLEYDVEAVVFNMGPVGGQPPPTPDEMPWLEPVGGRVWAVDREALLQPGPW